MFRRDEGSCQRRFGAFFILALFVKVEEALGSDGADAGAADPVEVARAAALPSIVVKAVQAASAKLTNPACREVFSDFRDGRGNTLQQNLDALGVSAAGYLAWTVLYDGYGKPICQRRQILAATTPGSRAIFVCTAQFSAVAQRQPGLAADLVIHEELHSLGLGEAPPESQAITAQVIARCGR